MADLVELRADLKTALEGAGRVVFAYPKENASVPAIVLVPSNPYLDPQSIGNSLHRVAVRFDITIMVSAADNQTGLSNIEKLAFDVLNLLPTGYAIIGGFNAPSPQEIAGQMVIVSQVTVETSTTITMES